MAETHPTSAARHVRISAAGAGTALVTVAILALVGWRLLYPYRIGPKQPVPFSHRVHAGDKRISCFFCHPFADRGPSAGMPEVSTCLLCHNQIVPQFPPVQKVHEFFANDEPVPWVRVTRLADHVHFPHHMHLRKGVDCGRCHGDVKAMDRVLPAHRFKMGFCVDCHRAQKASVDCLVCHY